MKAEKVCYHCIRF